MTTLTEGSVCACEQGFSAGCLAHGLGADGLVCGGQVQVHEVIARAHLLGGPLVRVALGWDEEPRHGHALHLRAKSTEVSYWFQTQQTPTVSAILRTMTNKASSSASVSGGLLQHMTGTN